MEKKKEGLILSVRCSELKQPAQDSVKLKCKDCDSDCWVSPSSHKVFSLGNCSIMCQVCFSKEMIRGNITNEELNGIAEESLHKVKDKTLKENLELENDIIIDLFPQLSKERAKKIMVQNITHSVQFEMCNKKPNDIIMGLIANTSLSLEEKLIIAFLDGTTVSEICLKK